MMMNGMKPNQSKAQVKSILGLQYDEHNDEKKKKKKKKTTTTNNNRPKQFLPPQQ